MKLLAISQRVSVESPHNERRDCLDQRWVQFLLSRARPEGVLLTGGGDIGALGGTDPERDSVERCLIDWAREESMPILGVCRGMQVVQNLFGVPMNSVENHVATQHTVSSADGSRVVNSYHAFGALESVPELDVVARAPDGVIEAVRHKHEPISGIMWHPERGDTTDPCDVQLFKDTFGGQKD
jgi:gamma-glutamyl-gamma-aminobutyrate hydrolase PuuD